MRSPAGSRQARRRQGRRRLISAGTVARRIRPPGAAAQRRRRTPDARRSHRVRPDMGYQDRPARDCRAHIDDPRQIPAHQRFSSATRSLAKLPEARAPDFCARPSNIRRAAVGCARSPVERHEVAISGTGSAPTVSSTRSRLRSARWRRASAIRSFNVLSWGRTSSRPACWLAPLALAVEKATVDGRAG